MVLLSARRRRRPDSKSTRSILAHATDRTRAQIAEYQCFRDLSREFLWVSEAWGQAQLALARRTSAVADKKAMVGAGRGRRHRRDRPPASCRPAAELDFEAVETAAWNRGLALAASVLLRALNAAKSDAPGPGLPCPTCPQQAPYAGRSPKTFQTLLGHLTLRRASYHCQACGRGFCPRDQAWVLAGTSHSPGLARVLGRASAYLSFAGMRALVWELAGVRVTTQRVERTAKVLGEEIAAVEREAVVPELSAASTIYAGLDSTGIPMRLKETQGRVGNLEVTWTAETRPPEGHPPRDWCWNSDYVVRFGSHCS